MKFCFQNIRVNQKKSREINVSDLRFYLCLCVDKL